jgi:hypothetical protein
MMPKSRHSQLPVHDQYQYSRIQDNPNTTTGYSIVDPQQPISGISDCLFPPTSFFWFLSATRLRPAGSELCRGDLHTVQFLLSVLVTAPSKKKGQRNQTNNTPDQSRTCAGIPMYRCSAKHNNAPDEIYEKLLSSVPSRTHSVLYSARDNKKFATKREKFLTLSKAVNHET